MKQLIGITSPPYEEAQSGGGIAKTMVYSGDGHKLGICGYKKSDHNFSEGQIGSLKSSTKQELDFDITKYHKCGGELYWHGCYGSDAYYKQFVTPESYAHPAKISFLLAERIFKHLEHLGLLKEGMTICDFMSGSGRIPLMASLKGYASVGVELENHFVKMSNDNKKFAENKIGRKLDMTTIQGDSRQLSKILGNADVGIVSPPYEKQRIADGQRKASNPNIHWREWEDGRGYNLDNPSNIGNLPYKEMVGVVSPPYKDVLEGGKPDYILELAKKKQGLGSVFSDKDNIQNPYSPQNIANLKDKELVGITSPPYFQSGGEPNPEDNTINQRNRISLRNNYNTNNPDNLGNQQGQSYLFAMLQCYQEAYKSGMSVICTITKNPTRAGKLRRLDLDTAFLLEKSGFRVVDYHRAILFKIHEQQTLTGSTKKEYKGRLSFFKRLSLSKGNLASEFEDIIIAIR